MLDHAITNDHSSLFDLFRNCYYTINIIQTLRWCLNGKCLVSTCEGLS